MKSRIRSNCCLPCATQPRRDLAHGEVERPKLPLGQSDLLINGPRDLAIGHEIRSELASATAVDVIVSFVKWTGVRVIRPELEDFARRHPGKLRLLTTTYMGATEIEALDALVELGAEVKVWSQMLAARVYTPRRGSSIATQATRPESSARRSCLRPHCLMGASGMSAFQWSTTAPFSRSSSRPSISTGQTWRSSHTTARSSPRPLSTATRRAICWPARFRSGRSRTNQ